MKLIELEINNIRGICHALLRPNGNNFLVWGPNGSGKSAVVDALDFLLTGKITRLMGKGTRDLTLARHGPHIDHKVEEADVRALVEIKGYKEPIEIRRNMANPSKLIYQSKFKSFIDPVVTIAKRGQHVLTRREILKYITAEGGTRAQEIQELLNISDVENVRRSLVQVQNTLRTEYLSAQTKLISDTGTVVSTCNIKTYKDDLVLSTVNQLRKILGGQALDSLHSSQLKVNLQQLKVVIGEAPINVSFVETDVARINLLTSSERENETSRNKEQIQKLLEEIRSDPDLLRAIKQNQLIVLGLNLIDETGKCPLCDTPWKQRELLDYLKNKLRTAERANSIWQQVENHVSPIKERVIATRDSLGRIIANVGRAEIGQDISEFSKWYERLNDLVYILEDPIHRYPSYSIEGLDQLQAPKDITVLLRQNLVKIKEKYPEASPEQTAWDTLTRLEENLKALDKTQTVYDQATKAFQIAGTFLASFEKARDKVIEKLYENIRDRFVGLYKQLHQADEGNFQANLTPDGAALNLEVDFYGRGVHPPHALHSEGHQDSMGLCLYLALAEYLNSDLINLIVLDDVVMSVDAEHRRELCRLLTTAFPDRQFFITTHDKTWSCQLGHEGLIPSKNMIEFYNWKVETGPQVLDDTDIWSRIDKELEQNDVPGASVRLRRGAEQFFAIVCDALQAPVRYKINGRWELGDYLPAALSQYKKLLKSSKASTLSWGNNELFETLVETESTASQIFQRLDIEQWAVNVNVHYNNWANFTKVDFRPVVDVFRDLFGLYECSKCGGILHVTCNGPELESLRCNCGQVNWNLIKNKNKAKVNN